MSRKLDSATLRLSIMYAEQLIQPENWVAKAEELLAASRLLEEKLNRYRVALSPNGEISAELAGLGGLQAPYFMLIAYALENYCKAYLVLKNEPELRNCVLNKLPEYHRDHDLVRLVASVDFPLTVPEEELLARLTRCSRWAGRYPVPTGPNGMLNVQEFSDGQKYLLAYFAQPDVERIHDFIGRIRKHVDS